MVDDLVHSFTLSLGVPMMNWMSLSTVSQVYPAVEYDFVPGTAMVPVGDYIHVQWTGSDTTPNGDGQGTQGTDRNNLVLQQSAEHFVVDENTTIAGKAE